MSICPRETDWENVTLRQNGIFALIVQCNHVLRILNLWIQLCTWRAEVCCDTEPRSRQQWNYLSDLTSWLYPGLRLFLFPGFHPQLQEEHEHCNFPKAVQAVSHWQYSRSAICWAKCICQCVRVKQHRMRHADQSEAYDCVMLTKRSMPTCPGTSDTPPYSSDRLPPLGNPQISYCSVL